MNLPIVVSPEEATYARRAVSTGLEHGEAINAEVAPNRKACTDPDASTPSFLSPEPTLASKDGNSMFTKPNKYIPIVKNSREESKADASPSTPDDPKTLPSIAAESPNKVRVVASPAAYKADLVRTGRFSPLDLLSEPPRYVNVRGRSEAEHGENAVSNPAP